MKEMLVHLWKESVLFKVAVAVVAVVAVLQLAGSRTTTPAPAANGGAPGSVAVNTPVGGGSASLPDVPPDVKKGAGSMMETVSDTTKQVGEFVQEGAKLGSVSAKTTREALFGKDKTTPPTSKDP